MNCSEEARERKSKLSKWKSRVSLKVWREKKRNKAMSKDAYGPPQNEKKRIREKGSLENIIR